ncbi:MAG: hypothetical protein ACN4GM_06445 [Gammaproteobacteria bacterium]
MNSLLERRILHYSFINVTMSIQNLEDNATWTIYAHLAPSRTPLVESTASSTSGQACTLLQIRDGIDFIL